MDDPHNTKSEANTMALEGIGYIGQPSVHDTGTFHFLDETPAAEDKSSDKGNDDEWSPDKRNADLMQKLNKASSEKVNELALSIVRQSLEDAADGDYDAMLWLIEEGREWLEKMGVPIQIVDSWGIEL